MGSIKVLNEIAAERARGIQKGYSIDHDDTSGLDLALMSAAYAKCYSGGSFYTPDDWYNVCGRNMPTPASRRDALIKAGALIVAEIEKIDRIKNPLSIPTNDRTRENFAQLLKYISDNVEKVKETE